MRDDNPEGSLVYQTAMSILEGTAQKSLVKHRNRVSEASGIAPSFRGVEWVAPTAELQVHARDQVLSSWWSHHWQDAEYRRLMRREYSFDGHFAPHDELDLRSLLRRLEQSKLLTVTRFGEGGTHRINQVVHGRMQQLHDSDLVAPFLPCESIDCTR